MRSRFTHDGQLDHHADNEHELFRRADEALERQRQAEHATRATEQPVEGRLPVSLPTGFASSSSTGQAAVAATIPRMPHEEIAERFGLKSTTGATRSHRGRR